MEKLLSSQKDTQDRQPVKDTDNMKFSPLHADNAIRVTSDVLSHERTDSLNKHSSSKSKIASENRKYQGSELEKGQVDLCPQDGSRTDDHESKLVPKPSRRPDALASSNLSLASTPGSIMDVLPVGAMQTGSEAYDGDSDGKARSFSCRVAIFVDTSLLKLWTLWMIVVSQGLGSITNLILVYMPAVAIQAGMSKPDAALLLTIAGCMDLVVRIVAGLVADKQWVSKESMIAGSLTFVAVVVQFATFYTTYAAFVFFAFVVGIFSGFRQNLLASILLDYFGAEKAPRALGIDVMCVSITASINFPIIGALADATGDFAASLHYAGALVFLSILIILMHPVFKRWDAENGKKAQLATQANGV